ncbi:hypothetical protein [Gynuella sp.]|uniref:hypothetical protein n=1 Tax=Gynuella sp. TaxID=2969146 RepID=UPI003D10EA17
MPKKKTQAYTEKFRKEAVRRAMKKGSGVFANHQEQSMPLSTNILVYLVLH